MKVKLFQNEEIYVWTEDKRSGHVYELPEKLVTKFRKISKEYFRIQEKLDKTTGKRSGY